MKKKTLSVLLSSLLAVSLTGVGFASWIITGDATDQTGEGSVTVETIEDRRVKLEALQEGNEPNIILGHPAESSVSNAWLTPSSDIKTEDLTATFKYSITNSQYAKVEAKVADDATALKGLISAGYINVGFNHSIEDNILTLNVVFSWGEYFDLEADPVDSLNSTDNLNPYVYYNTKYTGNAVTDDVITGAIEVMNTIKAVTTYKITLSATYQAA